MPANLAVAASLLIIARAAGLRTDVLGLSRDRVRRGLMVGLGTAAVIALAFVVALQFSEFDGAFESDDVRADSDFDRWFVPLVRIPLGTALFEEILFRSVLLGAMLVLFGRIRAVLVSSLVFGLWHIVPAWESASGSGLVVGGSIVGTVLVTTLGGIGFALLRLWSGSVVAPILAHSATNSFAYVSALIALDLLF